MNNPITLSFILKANDIEPQVIYDLTIDGLDVERCKLQANAASLNAAGYCQSLKKIQQYYRILSVFRGDTLNSITCITRREESSN